jgi:hypothetical protein
MRPTEDDEPDATQILGLGLVLVHLVVTGELPGERGAAAR